MKLSICIPVYNQEVRALVNALQKEIQSDALDAEIILIDDASEEKYKNLNAALSVNQNIHLPKNIGRAAIRNLFLEYAKGEFLLFLDCDSCIINERFLNNYIAFLKEFPEVLVVNGGRLPSEIKPPKKFRLRWKYAQKRESISLIEKKRKPYAAFQTNNFLISKKLLSEISFSEKCKGYGYEDIVFALELKVKQIEIKYIDNPISNDDLETNDSYLNKIEESIHNLNFLFHSFPKSSSKDLKIIRFYFYLKMIKAEYLYLFLFLNVQEKLRTLIKTSCSLILLDLYKLGLFIERQHHTKN